MSQTLTLAEQTVLAAVEAYYGNNGMLGDYQHTLAAVARELGKRHGSEKAKERIAADEELTEKIRRVMYEER